MKKCTKVAIWGFLGCGIIGGIMDAANPDHRATSSAAHESKNDAKVALFTPEAQDVFKILAEDDALRAAQGNSTAFYFPYIKKASTSQIIRAYKNNEPRADRDYRNQLVLLNGTVKKIEQSITGTNYLVFRTGDFSQLRADFDRSQNDAALDINTGDNVSLICTIKGTSLGVTSADDCFLKNDWVDYQTDRAYRNAMELLESGYPFGGTSDEQESGLKKMIVGAILVSKDIKDGNLCPKGITSKCVQKAVSSQNQEQTSEQIKTISQALGFSFDKK